MTNSELSTDKNAFNTVDPRNRLVVRDSDTWNAVWGLVTAYYWASHLPQDIDWCKVNERLNDKSVSTGPIRESTIKEAFNALYPDLKLHDPLLTYAIYKNEQGELPSSCILFYTLNKVGVRNIAYDAEKLGVLLLSFAPPSYHEKLDDKGEIETLLRDQLTVMPEKVENSYYLDGYPYPYIVNFRIATTLPTPRYIEKDVYTVAKNHWSEITGNLIIKLPPIDVEENSKVTDLSRYISLTPYFPFGLRFSVGYDNPPGSALAGDTISSDTDNSGNTQSRTSQSSRVTASPTHFAITDITSPSSGSSDLDLMNGDRGGVEGLHSDTEWLYFVPRMVSYNWSKEFRGTLKEGAWLSNYREILDCFDYSIPEGLNIQVSYASQPIDFLHPKSIQEYVSIMEIVLPKPPPVELQPIALADFNAKRASVPFTCA